jgi:hypothetical protein
MTEKTLGAILAVSTAEGSVKTITNATQASPVVLTCAAHGITPGSIIRATGFGGMTQLNDRAFVATNTASPLPSGSFQLKGVNGTGYSAFSSNGSVYVQTMANIGYVDSIGPGFNGQTPEIDVTHLRSVGREYLGGLLEPGEVPFSFWDQSDTGQTRLKVLQESQAVVAFSITLLTSGRVAAFLGYVKQLGFDTMGVDNAFKGTGVIKVTNRWADFA